MGITSVENYSDVSPVGNRQANEALRFVNFRQTQKGTGPPEIYSHRVDKTNPAAMNTIPMTRFQLPRSVMYFRLGAR